MDKFKHNLKNMMRELLFNDGCIVCGNKLDITQKAVCDNCYSSLYKTASLKHYRGIFYFWINNNNVFKFIYSLKFSKININELISSILEKKLKFLITNENITVKIPLVIKRRSIFKELLKSINIYYDYELKVSYFGGNAYLSNRFFITKKSIKNKDVIIFVDKIDLKSELMLRKIEKLFKEKLEANRLIFCTISVSMDYLKKVNGLNY